MSRVDRYAEQPDVATSTATLRRANAAAVLGILRTDGESTVTDLQSRTGLSRRTLDAVVDDLLALGIVESRVTSSVPSSPTSSAPSGPSAGRATRGGRPARRLRFAPDAGRVVGVDIGRTRITAVVADLAGRELGRFTANATPEFDRRRRLATIWRAVDRAAAHAGTTRHDLIAAGIGTPGPLDPATGTLGACRVLAGWANLDLRTRVERHLACRALVEKDANLAAVAETVDGEARGCDNAVVLMVGERPGTGLIVDGKLTYGHAGWSGELYFWGLWNTYYPMVPNPLRTRLARVVDRLRRSRSTGVDAIGPAAKPFQASDAVNIDLPAALAALATGPRPSARRARESRAARAALVRFATGTAWTLATLTSLLGPERIIVTGMPSPLADALVPAWTDLLDETVPGHPTRLRASRLDEEAVVRGAVLRATELAETEILARLNPAPARV